MSKAILLSIKPKYVADILNGKKTIEIRKTMPKCDLPIDVYIYCTKAKKKYDYLIPAGLKWEKQNDCSGKVVAKFTLRKVVEEFVFAKGSCIPLNWHISSKLDKLCLTENDIYKYANNNDCSFYLWHIEDLVVFDEPKKLSEFNLTKAPQSYCYIEREE